MESPNSFLILCSYSHREPGPKENSSRINSPVSHEARIKNKNTGLFMEKKKWSRADLNRRPPPCEGGALPLSYCPIYLKFTRKNINVNSDAGLSPGVWVIFEIRSFFGYRKTFLSSISPIISILVNTMHFHRLIFM